MTSPARGRRSSRAAPDARAPRASVGGLVDSAGRRLAGIVRAGGAVERLAKHQGMALGIFEDVPYKTDSFALREGDALGSRSCC